MSFAVVLATVQRRREQYLGRTLTSLDRADVFTSPLSAGVYVAEGGSPSTAYLDRELGDYPVVVTHGVRGQTSNRSSILALQLGLDSGADWIVALEDDVQVCSRFLESIDGWLRDHARPSYRVYTLYTPYREVRQALARRQTSWIYPLPRYYGTQGLVFRREDAASLVDYFWTGPWHAYPSSKGFDFCVRDWHRARYPTLPAFLATVPSFVQHIGRVSALGNDARFHTAGSFPGESWKYHARSR